MLEMISDLLDSVHVCLYMYLVAICVKGCSLVCLVYLIAISLTWTVHYGILQPCYVSKFMTPSILSTHLYEYPICIRTTTMDHPLIQNYPLPRHMQSILQACSSANLPSLQALLKPYNYPQTGTSPTWSESDTSPPETWKMVTVAITHGNIHILSYLLTLYSRGGGWIECIPVIEAILNNPDVRVMTLIHNHSPRSIHYIFDSGETFLSTACRRCQYRSQTDPFMSKMLPLIHYLLDNGASPAEHVYDGFHGDGALLPAVQSSLPFEVIEKMIRLGAVVGVEEFGEAVGGKRIDVIRLFMKKGVFVRVLYAGLCDVARQRANGDVDGEIVGLVERGVRRRVWRDRRDLCLSRLCLFGIYGS